MTRIDAHSHFRADHPQTIALIEELDLKFLNICGAFNRRDWRTEQAQGYKKLAQQHPDRFAWCTTFNLPDLANANFDATRYVETVIAGLEQDFADGAVACKIWKNIGMEIQDASGRYILVDDPLFEPILDAIARADKSLLIHNGEPLACWQPFDGRSPHADYYRDHPEWHMYGRTDVPSHAALVAAQDRMVEKHPNLRVIAAHFGALEFDVAEVAARFERYPNFAVDISARMRDLLLQDSQKVRQFFIDYSDRILYGTDLDLQRAHSTMDSAQRQNLLNWLREEHEAHFKYFEGSGPIKIERWETEALALPQDVLQKFYRDNARTWYPGL
jgi:predicted TIM-barrel fold metal-dependent hydrolase